MPEYEEPLQAGRFSEVITMAATNLEDLEKILTHLDESGELDNVISDLEELGQKDPTLFTGRHGEEAREYINDAKILKDQGHIIHATSTLDDAITELKERVRDHLAGRGGRKRRHKTTKSRRGRKSRRKSLRQRK